MHTNQIQYFCQPFMMVISLFIVGYFLLEDPVCTISRHILKLFVLKSIPIFKVFSDMGLVHSFWILAMGCARWRGPYYPVPLLVQMLDVFFIVFGYSDIRRWSCFIHSSIHQTFINHLLGVRLISSKGIIVPWMDKKLEGSVAVHIVACELTHSFWKLIATCWESDVDVHFGSQWFRVSRSRNGTGEQVLPWREAVRQSALESGYPPTVHTP